MTGTPQHHTGAAARSTQESGAPTGAPLLAVRGLVKDYPGQRALQGVDFDVRAGEIHALLGENGAGKSTLIRIVAGSERATEGTILVDGTEHQISSPGEARALGISVIHQQRNLAPDLTVAENVLLGRRSPRRAGFLVDAAGERREAQRVLDEVGVDVSPRALARDLAPHEVALVAVAKALVGKARVVILDEPTTALLPAEVDVLFDRMRALATQGIGLVLVTHRIGEVFHIADRITVMRDGRNVTTRPAGDLDHDALIELLVGDAARMEAATARPEIPADVPAVLEARGLTGPVLRGVDLTLRAGEVVGLASLPGGGASETLTALFGAGGVQHGEVRLDGRPVRLSSPGRARDAGIALVPRDRHAQAMLLDHGVRENMSLATLRFHRLDPFVGLLNRRRERRAARAGVASLGVKTPSVETSMQALSGGNQQKVVIGRWLARDARVYLLDSPTAAVDVQSKADIYRMVRDLTDRGRAVAFASTELEELVRLCNRVVVLAEGRVVGELRGDDITEAGILRLSATGLDPSTAAAAAPGTAATPVTPLVKEPT